MTLVGCDHGHESCARCIAKLTRLEIENERLRAALREICKIGEDGCQAARAYLKYNNEEAPPWHCVSAYDAGRMDRIARAALASKEGK